MRKLAFINLLLFILRSLNAQNELIIEGQTFTNSEETWLGVDIPRATPAKLIFRNNSITSSNKYGYMLQAGDESATPNNNHLDGAVITGNRLSWSGTDMEVIPHGIFTGHNIDVLIKYNYLQNIPMGIIRKSSTNMSNNGGGVAYNIVKGGAVGIVVKGMSNVRIFNNTLYCDRTPSQTWRPLVHIYSNTDFGGNSVSHGTKIYNNIFYTKHKTYSITVQDGESLMGFECDYNIYWCESGTPVFNVGGTEKTFAQWQTMGFDTHSVIVNPDFIDSVSFIPAKRLDYGVDLGEEWKEGLPVNARWGTTSPGSSLQNGIWQVGAIVHNESAPTLAIAPVYTSAFFKENNPYRVELNFNSVNPEIMPPSSAFTITVNSVPAEVVKVEIDRNTVFLTVASPISVNDNVIVSYTVPGTNPLQNFSGGVAESFYSQKVINIKNPENLANPLIYPNPARNFINIMNLQPAPGPYFIRIFDMAGRLRSELRLDPGFSTRIPVGLAPGMYLLQVILGGESQHVHRLVVIQ